MEFDAQSPFDVVPLDPAAPSRGEKWKDAQFNSPSPSLTLAQGLFVLMPNREVLNPFNQQNMMWDDLWLEQNSGAALRVFVIRHWNKQTNEAEKAAVNDVCTFIKRMKLNTCSFQQ
jgi:hypothetical protein